MTSVSVIVPTFNRRCVLERALRSVVQQTHDEWELIVIDDGSTDDTWGFLQGWASRARVPQPIRLERVENGGVSKARNLGARMARHSWLAFLDSDDEWLPEKLSRQTELCETFPLIHGEEIWIRRGVRVNPMKKHAKSGGRVFSRCVELCCISPSTSMVRKDVFFDAGGFREDFPVCEDYDLWLKIAARHEVGFVETPVIIKHGGNPDQLSANYTAMDLLRVRALAPFLSSREISDDERHHVAEVMIAKCEILRRGFEKHGNLQFVDEIKALRESALQAFGKTPDIKPEPLDL